MRHTEKKSLRRNKKKETKKCLRKQSRQTFQRKKEPQEKESEKKPIILSITDGSLEVHVNSSMGSLNEDIDINKDGKDIMIGFNPKFLIDALKVIDDEQIYIYLVNPKAPCFIKDKEESYIYLILPVNFTAE